MTFAQGAVDMLGKGLPKVLIQRGPSIVRRTLPLMLRLR